jgi:phosphatidylinositol alpha-1,6-mannosyltransferase
LIAGDGPGRAVLHELVSRSRVRGQIEFRGHVPEERVEALWSRATLFAMPSLREGFGLAYIEAMRHALPVLASVHDAAPEINLDGITGHNVDLGRPGALVDRLVHLLRDRDAARALGRAGQARWREHFTYSAFRRRFAPLLDELFAL